jgi:hypothetical protein
MGGRRDGCALRIGWAEREGKGECGFSSLVK